MRERPVHSPSPLSRAIAPPQPPDQREWHKTVVLAGYCQVRRRCSEPLFCGESNGDSPAAGASGTSPGAVGESLTDVPTVD